MPSFIANPVLIAISIVLAYLSSVYVGGLHCLITSECSASFPSVGFTPYIGLVLGYSFFAPAFLIAFRYRGAPWWLLLSIGPVLLWSLSSGSYSVVGELALVSFSGTAIGLLLNILFRKFIPSFMSKVI